MFIAFIYKYMILNIYFKKENILLKNQENKNVALRLIYLPGFKKLTMILV